MQRGGSGVGGPRHASSPGARPEPPPTSLRGRHGPGAGATTHRRAKVQCPGSLGVGGDGTRQPSPLGCGRRAGARPQRASQVLGSRPGPREALHRTLVSQRPDSVSAACPPPGPGSRCVPGAFQVVIVSITRAACPRGPARAPCLSAAAMVLPSFLPLPLLGFCPHAVLSISRAGFFPLFLSLLYSPLLLFLFYFLFPGPSSSLCLRIQVFQPLSCLQAPVPSAPCCQVRPVSPGGFRLSGHSFGRLVSWQMETGQRALSSAVCPVPYTSPCRHFLHSGSGAQRPSTIVCGEMKIGGNQIGSITIVMGRQRPRR